VKKLSNLKGAKALNKNEQKSINGGRGYDCPGGQVLFATSYCDGTTEEYPVFCLGNIIGYEPCSV